MALEDYKDIVGAAAGFVTFCQMFSGVFLCKDIYKSGSTDNIPVVPFLGGLVMQVLMFLKMLNYELDDKKLTRFWAKLYKTLNSTFQDDYKVLCESYFNIVNMEVLYFFLKIPITLGFLLFKYIFEYLQVRLYFRSILLYQHALLINDGAMMTVNLGGTTLHIIYLLFYFLWTQKKMKSKFYKQVWKGIALTFLLLLYVQIEDSEKVEFRFGMIVTVLLMCLIASPLFSLGEVIRTQSTKSLPFPMIISGFVVSLHWLLYGIIIRNSFVMFQNALASLLCLVQLSLFIIFPNKKREKKTQ